MPRLIEALDLAGRVREEAFARLFADGSPVLPAQLAERLGAGPSGLDRVIDDLVATGWLDRNQDGQIVGSAGLSLDSGMHSLEVGGRRFRTWCAFDAIGIPAALGSDARVETQCGICGRSIDVTVIAGTPDRTNEAQLWLAAGGDDLRADFCSPTVLLCSLEHGHAWAERQAGRGRLVSLAQAADEGRAMWAGCARAVEATR